MVTSDRFLIKILDHTVSIQDIGFQLRNLKALNCIYEDAIVVQYFEKSFIQKLDKFVKDFPKNDLDVRNFMHTNDALMKNIRYFFKMLRYSEDQKSDLSTKLIKLIRESAKANGCDSEVLYQDTLKTNFINLLEMELYLRSRYGNQIKNNHKFETIRPSIDLFVESLDKQFNHEYYW